MRRSGATLILLLAVCGAARAAPIPDVGGATPFVGAPATPRPLYAPAPPRHPFMAANGRSELHDDAYQTDTYQQSGPLGIGMHVNSTLVGGDCASLTFDARSRLVAVCVGLSGPRLYMFDPADLHTLASFALPGRQPSPRILNPFQDFGGGGYFYLDDHDRVVVPTTTRHVLVIAERPGPDFALVGDYDLSGVVPQGDSITSALPDWRGRIVFESFNGIVGTIDPPTGAVHSLALHEETENSFAVDETGAIFVVSTRALYRLDLARDGTPVVTWDEAYPNSGIHEPGQVDAGSGTTPTVQGPYVTITDNGNPLDIVVYRRARTVSGPRRVCVQPIFAAGAGADENSLIGAGDTMIAENNYGYTGPTAVEFGATTAPGMVRVDIAPDGTGCRVVWRNDAVHVPTAVSKLSLASGLVYTYTKDAGNPLDPWYLTAIDAHGGRVIYKRLAGMGIGFNNNYAPVTIGPDGSAYVGVLGGLVQVRDARPPNVPFAQPPRSATNVVPAALRLRVRHRGRSLFVAVSAPARVVDRVTYRLDGRTAGRAMRRPFAARVSLAGLAPGSRHRLVAIVTLRSGRRVTLARAVHVPGLPRRSGAAARYR